MIDGGGAGGVRSVCDPPGGSLSAIVELIHSRLSGFCQSRPLPEGARCVMEEELPSADPCPPTRIDRGLHDGHRRCQICRDGDGVTVLEDANQRDLSACAPISQAGDVWQYEAGIEVGCPETGAIAFHGASAPAAGSVISFRCLVEQCAAEPE